MKLIDRYLMKELLGPFIFTITATVMIYVGTGVALRIAELLSKYDTSFFLVLKLIVSDMPAAIYPSLPMSFLLATLLVFGKMSSSNEITALKSGGISFVRIIMPVAAFGLVVSGFAFLDAQYLVPAGNVTFTNIVTYDVMEAFPKPRAHEENIIIKDQVKYSAGQYSILYAKNFDPKSGHFNNICVEFFDDQKNLTGVISADTLIYENNKWLLHDGKFIALDLAGRTAQTIQFQEQELVPKKQERDAPAYKKDVANMSISELRQVIELFKHEGDSSYKRLEKEAFDRSAIPFASFIMAFIGPPLGIQANRSSSSAGMGLAFAVLLVYYTIYAIMNVVVENGLVPALFGAWFPNLVCLAVGIWLTIRANRK